VSIHSVFIAGDEMFRHLQDQIITKWDLVRSSGKGCMVSRTLMILCWGRMRRQKCRMMSESSTVNGVDIVLNHRLQETSFTKDSYKGYIKDYMKAKLEENNPDGVKPFTTGAQEEIKMIMGNMKNYQFFYFTGESMNPDGMVGLLDIHKDGITPFKDGLEMEKCFSPVSLLV
uniref:TCTP domain-containing protein n=1 Tax=Oncorhynchus tshawytscha TaxID=74940 RepID=A0A8C8D0Q3_ONCTS